VVVKGEVRVMDLLLHSFMVELGVHSFSDGVWHEWVSGVE